MIGGLILAGGRSSRFGREKALAELGGQPLIAHVHDVLGRGASALAVSAAPDSGAAAYAAEVGLSCLHDREFDPPSPLAGVRAGLRWTKAEGLDWLVTAPCDTPFLPPDLCQRLVRACGRGGAVASTPAGLQPLCAIWPVVALERVEAAPDKSAIRKLLADLRAARVSFDDEAAFANLNTPEDHARARVRLEAEDPGVSAVRIR